MKVSLIKNLSLEVIATYDNHNQEMFKIKLNEAILKTEKTLLDFIRTVLDYPENTNLKKLSLCWIFKNKNYLKKYPTINESINKNAKYFFELGELVK